VIRLRDGETNMLAGLIRDDERRSIEGIPGLSDIPGVGRLFAHTTRTTEQTDIILTLTPHIIRVLDLDEADLRAFRAGRDSVVPLPELPAPLPPPVEAPPPPTPAR
jgi:general secretion pathway protein D